MFYCFLAIAIELGVGGPLVHRAAPVEIDPGAQFEIMQPDAPVSSDSANSATFLLLLMMGTGLLVMQHQGTPESEVATA